MGWKVRVLKGRDMKNRADHGGDLHIPDYGSDASLFTIRVAHNGLFRKPKLSKQMDYKRGAASYVDFVDRDCISIKEITDMLKEIGVRGKYRIYYTESVCHDPCCLVPLETDRDVVCMGISVGDDKCMGLYVDHELKSVNEISPYWNCGEVKGTNCVDNGCSNGDGIDEGDGDGLDDVGDVDVGIGIEMDEGPANGDVGDVDAGNGVEMDEGDGLDEGNGDGIDNRVDESAKDWGEGCSTGIKGEESYYCELGEADWGVSCGEDSEHSDYYIDSDGNYELDDDEDFVENIDPHLEWIGLQSLKSTELKHGKKKAAALKTTRRSKKKNIQHHVPTYKGKKVFDPNVDYR